MRARDCAPVRLPTHTALRVTAIATGRPATANGGPTWRWVRMLMRATVWRGWLAIHTKPRPTAISVVPRGTGIVPRRSPVAASRRISDVSGKPATQT